MERFLTDDKEEFPDIYSKIQYRAASDKRSVSSEKTERSLIRGLWRY